MNTKQKFFLGGTAAIIAALGASAHILTKKDTLEKYDVSPMGQMYANSFSQNVGEGNTTYCKTRFGDTYSITNQGKTLLVQHDNGFKDNRRNIDSVIINLETKEVSDGNHKNIDLSKALVIMDSAYNCFNPKDSGNPGTGYNRK